MEREIGTRRESETGRARSDRASSIIDVKMTGLV
jgi:hypothetical protein